MKRFSSSKLISFTIALTLSTNSIGIASSTVTPTIVAPKNVVDEGESLSHPVLTATDAFEPKLISPVPDGYGGSATSIVISMPFGGGAELIVNGRKIGFDHLGKQEIVKATGETRWYYYGIGLEPGINHITIAGLGVNSARFKETNYQIYGRGPAVSLKAILKTGLIADGVTSQILRVEGVDRWNHPAMSGVPFRVSIISGDIHFGSILKSEASASTTPSAPATGGKDLRNPDFQVSSGPGGFGVSGLSGPLGLVTPADYSAVGDENGGADIPVTPGLRAGEAIVRIVSDDISYDFHTEVSAYIRKPIVTGLITGGIGAVPGDPGTNASDTQQANARRGRIAIFGTGKISKNTLATVAYDTAGILDENPTTGSFNENPNQRPYLTYGDSSQRRADALSSDHLFARVDAGKTSAMWGEFRAKSGDDATGSLGGLDLLLNGARVGLNNDTTKIEAFRASAGVAYARQVFSPTGLTSLQTALHSNIIVGSDSITLVTIDRHMGYIISEQSLLRNIDYVIDYGSGQIRWINPPSPYDESFNPEQILVQYEYRGVGGSVVSGGRASTKLGNVRLGMGYANDSTGVGNVSLFGQNISGILPNGIWRIEHLASSGILGSQIPYIGSQIVNAGTSGSALRGAASGGFGRSRYDFVYQSTTPGFNNPFGGLASPGLRSVRLGITNPLSNGDLSLLFDSERNSAFGSDRSDTSVTAKIHKKVGRKLKLVGGIIHRVVASNGVQTNLTALGSSQASNPVAFATPAPVVVSNPEPLHGSVTQVEIGATYALSPGLEVSVDRIADLRGDTGAAQSQPSQTTAQLSANLGNHSRGYIRELWTATQTQSFATSTSALAAASGATHVMEVGIERQIGTATTVNSQYSIQNVGNQNEIYSSIGIKEQILNSKKLTSDVIVQRANASGSNGSGFNLYGMNLSYIPSPEFRSTVQYQIRTGGAPGSTLAFGAAGYLGGGLSLIGSLNEVHTALVTTSDDRISLAYRPVNDDRSAVLFGYERVKGNGAVLGEQTQLLSLDGLVRPTRRLEASARIAYKMDGDSYYPAHSGLVGLRLTDRITPRFDVSGEVRAHGVSGIANSSVAGYALETGYRVGDQFRFALGWNFQQTPDSSLAAPPRKRGMYATFTTVVNSIFGFGKNGH